MIVFNKFWGCTHWSYGLEEGHTKCWLRTSDHGAEPHDDFVSGDSSCVPPEYPTCLKTHIKYESEGEQALFDISRLGKTIGCTDKLCEATWHYHSPSLDDCATTCAQVLLLSWFKFHFTQNRWKPLKHWPKSNQIRKNFVNYEFAKIDRRMLSPFFWQRARRPRLLPLRCQRPRDWSPRHELRIRTFFDKTCSLNVNDFSRFQTKNTKSSPKIISCSTLVKK